MAKYNAIIFDKDFYTIPQIVDMVAENLSLSVKDGNKKRNLTYFKLEKQIRRGLEKERDREKYTEGIDFILPSDRNSKKDTKGKDFKSPSVRKQQYSCKFLNSVINGKLFPKLCKYADEKKQREFAEWEQKADDYAHKYRVMLEDGSLDAFFKSEQKEESHDSSDFDYEMEESVNRHKLDIVVDFICKYLIQIDEDMLRDDLILDHFQDLQSPTRDGMLAAERLQNIGNYYQLREPFAALLKQARANAENI